MKQVSFYAAVLCLTLFLNSCGENSDTSQPEESLEDLSAIPTLELRQGDNDLLTQANQPRNEDIRPENMDLNSVLSYVFVEPADSLSVMRQYQKGDMIHLSLGGELNISAQINRNQESGENIRNLSAAIQEPHSGVVTISVGQNSMTGNIDLASENRLFHIRYDSVSGKHYLAEIDREKLDVMEGSEPLDADSD